MPLQVAPLGFARGGFAAAGETKGDSGDRGVCSRERNHPADKPRAFATERK